MKTSSVKQKGRLLQQLVRDKILDAFPRLEPDDVKSTSMGAGGEDIQLSPAARRWFPYSCECKSRAAIGTYAWYQQAKANAPKDMTPIVVMKQNHSKPLVVIDLDSFMELVR